MISSTVLRCQYGLLAAIMLASLEPSISFTGLAVAPGARAGRRPPALQQTQAWRPGCTRLSMQAQEGTQSASFLDGTFRSRRPALRARGGPLASNDAQSFLRLVRTGERWFELQTAVVSYTAPPDEQVC
jgi:hypothetical protein